MDSSDPRYEELSKGIASKDMKYFVENKQR